MSGEEQSVMIVVIAVAVSFMSFVVGCTIVNQPEDRAPLLKECVTVGFEWHDGFCTKPKDKGGDR